MNTHLNKCVNLLLFIIDYLNMQTNIYTFIQLYIYKYVSKYNPFK